MLKNPEIPKKLDYDNTISYFHYDAFVGDTTPIQQCKKLLPSEYLIYDIKNKTITKNKYIDFLIPIIKVTCFLKKNITFLFIAKKT